MPRETRGDGVGFLFKNEFCAKRSTENISSFRSFEISEIQLQVASYSLHIVVVYQPGSSNGNRLSTDFFLNEFGILLEQYTTDLSKLLIVGDFNFHVDDKNSKSASDFLELLELFNLKQHVCVPTHQAGHTLDLLITRNDDDILNSIWTHDPAISDHFYIHCSLNFSKPGVSRKEIEFRKIKSIDTVCFRNDIAVSSLVQSPSDDLTELVSQYDSVLSAILDNHAPIKKWMVTIRPAAPGYTERINDEMRKRRKLERCW